MRYIRAIVLAFALTLAPLGAGAADDAFSHAVELVALLKDHKFKDAAEKFYYPPTYTPEQLATDRTAIAGNLAALHREAGDIRSELRQPPQGLSKFYMFGFSGGDRPYSPSDVGAADVKLVVLETDFEREEKAQLALTYVYVQGRWQILAFQFQIPATEPNAMVRVDSLARRIFNPIPKTVP